MKEKQNKYRELIGNSDNELVQQSNTRNNISKEEFKEYYEFNRNKMRDELKWQLQVGGDVRKPFHKRTYHFWKRIEPSPLTGHICTRPFFLTIWPFEEDVKDTPYFIHPECCIYPGNPEQKMAKKGPLSLEQIRETIKGVRLGQSSIYVIELPDKTREIYKGDKGDIPINFLKQKSLPLKKGRLVQRIQAKHLARQIISISFFERHKKRTRIRNIEKISLAICGPQELEFDFYYGNRYEKYLQEICSSFSREGNNSFFNFENKEAQKTSKRKENKSLLKTSQREVGRFFNSKKRLFQYFSRINEEIPREMREQMFLNCFVPAQTKQEKQAIKELFKKSNSAYKSLREIVTGNNSKIPIDLSIGTICRTHYYRNEQEQEKYIKIDQKLGPIFKDLIDFALSESLIYLPKSIKTPEHIKTIRNKEYIKKYVEQQKHKRNLKLKQDLKKFRGYCGDKYEIHSDPYNHFILYFQKKRNSLRWLFFYKIMN
jgi:hypothetical protein